MEMKVERAQQRKIFLKRTGKLKKGWQDVPTRRLLRQRRVPVEQMVPDKKSVSQLVKEATQR